MGIDAYWPLFGLRLRTERLELRLPTDEELVLFLEAALDGIHPPHVMPFTIPWTRRPRPDLERSFLQYHWHSRAEWSPESWHLELGVFVDGEPVGFQGIGADDFATTRSVATGSWLTQRVQGQGIGTEMRAAVLDLAFAHLDTLEARSKAVDWNQASRKVSERLGYVEDGTKVLAVDGERTTEVRYVIDRDGWAQNRTHTVEVTGVDRCRTLFGLTED
ncbi:MAG: GNAT family protein [Nitriliruptorales bacterium]|nr:GNAT family protein [Nitriliruptorales bacterium]